METPKEKVLLFLHSRYPEAFTWTQLQKELPSLTTEEVVESLIELMDSREIESRDEWPPRYKSVKVTGGVSTTSIFDYHKKGLDYSEKYRDEPERVLSAPHFDPRHNPRLQ